MMLLSIADARSETSPTTYAVDPDATESQAIQLDPVSGFTRGFSLTVQRANAQQNEIQVWRRNDPAGTFVLAKTVSVPDVIAHIPFHLQSAVYHDLFVVTRSGNTYGFGILFAEGGGYNYTQIPTSYPASIVGPSRHIVAAGDNLRQGSPIQGIAVLVEPGVVLLFRDNGSSIDPNFEAYALPAGTDADIVKLADVTDDQKADLLVGSTAAGEVVVHVNIAPLTGGAGFQPLQTLSAPGLQFFDVADVDKSGAGRQDVALVRWPTASTASLDVYRSAGGSNPFGTADAYGVDPGAMHLAIADLPPGDVAPELFVASKGASSAALQEYGNSGNGAFALSGWYAAAANTNRVMALNYDFAGTFDPVADVVTIYPMSQSQAGLNPAENVVAGGGPDASTAATVRVYREDGVEIVTARTSAYGSGYGVRIGSGDINGQSPLHATDEILTAPERNPVFGGHVRAFERDRSGLKALQKVSFYAYGTLRYGAGAVGVSMDGDAFAEIMTGPGPGSVFGAHARGWNYDGAQLTAMSKVNFFAYGTPKYGLNVGGGDVDGDAYGEILTCPGPGAGFPQQVRGWNFDGGSITSMNRINFVAFAAPQKQGCFLCGGEIDADGFDEIAVTRGSGIDQVSQFRGFDYDGSAVSAVPGFDLTPFPGSYGGKVALGDVGGDRGDAHEDLVAGPGPDPAHGATIGVFHDGNPATTFDGVPGAAYGVNVATARLAF